MKTLFVSDLDGTLLDNRQQISPVTRTLLNHAISRGALFSIATARTPATVSRIMRGVDMQLPMVVMTGAALWDIRTGKYSEVQYFSPEDVRRVSEAYLSSGSGAFLYTLNPSGAAGRDIKIYHIGAMTEMERHFMHERIDSPFKEFFVDDEGNSPVPETIGDAVLYFGIRPTAEGENTFGHLSRIEGINPMFYHDWYGPEVAEVEAFPEDATKAKAIKRLAQLAGADRIVVFGDNLNDLSMMRIADWAVAMENAVDEVKYEADEVIGSNEADAVARKILEEL